MALAPRDQRHHYLRHEGLQYTNADIVDFEMILASYTRERSMGFKFSSARDFLGTTPSYTLIRDPMLRLCHILIACSIDGRIQAHEKVTVTDLFYLRGIDVDSVNVPYLLARYLRLISEDFPVIDTAKLMRLQLCIELDDTWSWVAPRPYRQPDVAAGAPEAAKDGPIADEERDIGQYGSRFLLILYLDSCWTLTDDESGWFRYTSFVDFQIPYERRTRRKTNGASTSTAHRDPQQPDP
nr:hypothetical protein [Tanacetum cinerariifolium]